MADAIAERDPSLSTPEEFARALATVLEKGEPGPALVRALVPLIRERDLAVRASEQARDHWAPQKQAVVTSVRELAATLRAMAQHTLADQADAVAEQVEALPPGGVVVLPAEDPIDHPNEKGEP